ncbi:MAG TPA: ATP-binding cassette domain-containing protein [Thermoleophilia bacterium]|nr:ATP-binding cassette domain-containing protein [Thermoleophilia bacterium]
MDNAIEARGLVKTYKGDIRALAGVSLSAAPGTVFGLLGPNGAGKSTAVKILTTLSHPDSGEAWVAGLSVLRDPAKVRKVIGVVAQNSGLDVNATGRENLVLQGRVYGMPGGTINRRADELLKRLGIADAANRVVRTWSGGMKRKLDVAVGLMHRPQVLFLDEPTTGLDPEARVDMWNEMAHLAGDEGLTILLTTHYLEEADKLAQRLAIVDKGKVVAEGSPEELKSELQGDAIVMQLEVPAPVERVREVLARVEGVSDVGIDERTVRARAAVGARALPLAIAELEGDGMIVQSVTVSRPSLDDVYLRYAGRAFAEADSEVKK